MENKKIGFVGGGNMAFAIAKGLVLGEKVKADNIVVSARTQTRLQTVWKELGSHTTTNNFEVVESCDVIFLAVKPHILPSILESISSLDIRGKLFISVAAGVTLAAMEQKLLSGGSRVIRTMPNTPCLVQSGVVVFSCGKTCTKDDAALLKTLLDDICYIEEVEEEQIDAMSALMGCSIAWYHMIIEAMSDGGVKNGIPRKMSYKLAAKAMEGTAKLVLESGKHPGQLKDEVTSPSGSTICGLYELEQGCLRGVIMKAVDAATCRNKELGKH